MICKNNANLRWHNMDGKELQLYDKMTIFLEIVGSLFCHFGTTEYAEDRLARARHRRIGGTALEQRALDFCQ